MPLINEGKLFLVANPPTDQPFNRYTVFLYTFFNNES